MLGIDVLKNLIGKQEVRDKKELMAFFKKYAFNGDISINPAVTAWCAAAVNACERAVGNKGTGLLNAQSFRKYGTKVNFCDIKYGDILVFHFPYNLPWQGHVTYFIDYDEKNNLLHCLGGNQNNMVCESVYLKKYLTDIRRY